MAVNRSYGTDQVGFGIGLSGGAVATSACQRHHLLAQSHGHVWMYTTQTAQMKRAQMSGFGIREAYLHLLTGTIGRIACAVPAKACPRQRYQKLAHAVEIGFTPARWYY